MSHLAGEWTSQDRRYRGDCESDGQWKMGSAGTSSRSTKSKLAGKSCSVARTGTSRAKLKSMPLYDLSALADALIGFPSRPNDSRYFESGTFNVDRAGGGARMHFFCMDAAGHAVVEVKLRGDAGRGLGEMQSVALRIPNQAAGVDDFIEQLRGVGKITGASAHLRQAAS